MLLPRQGAESCQRNLSDNDWRSCSSQIFASLQGYKNISNMLWEWLCHDLPHNGEVVGLACPHAALQSRKRVAECTAVLPLARGLRHHMYQLAQHWSSVCRCPLIMGILPLTSAFHSEQKPVSPREGHSAWIAGLLGVLELVFLSLSCLSCSTLKKNHNYLVLTFGDTDSDSLAQEAGETHMSFILKTWHHLPGS